MTGETFEMILNSTKIEEGSYKFKNRIQVFYSFQEKGVNFPTTLKSCGQETGDIYELIRFSNLPSRMWYLYQINI